MRSEGSTSRPSWWPFASADWQLRPCHRPFAPCSSSGSSCWKKARSSPRRWSTSEGPLFPSSPSPCSLETTWRSCSRPAPERRSRTAETWPSWRSSSTRAFGAPNARVDEERHDGHVSAVRERRSGAGLEQLLQVVSREHGDGLLGNKGPSDVDHRRGLDLAFFQQELPELLQGAKGL